MKWITVEPSLLMFGTAMQIMSLVDVNLLLQKACHPELSGPPDPTLKCDDEASAQKVVTDINTWRPILSSAIASIFIIFIGQWSDAHGKRRRPMLILPAVGEIICLSFLLLSVYFWRWSPQLTALFTVINSFTGSYTCVMAGCLIYISDITCEEERTIRIAFMESMVLTATMIGSYLAAFLRVQLNFYGTYALCILLHLVGLLLTMKLVKNSAVEETELKLFEGVFYPKNIIENFKIVVKKRENYGRVLLILTILVTPLFVAAAVGERSVTYLYTRYKFHMTEEEYNYFSALRVIVSAVGIIPLAIVFFIILKMTDAMFGLLASTTQIVSGVCYAMTQTRYQMLAITLLEPMRGVVTITSRSLLTKVVEPQELGRVTSLQSSLETFIPIIAIPIYNRFYKFTFEFLAGAFFFLNSCIGVVLLLFFIIIVFIERKRKNINKVGPADDIKSSSTEDTSISVS